MCHSAPLPRQALTITHLGDKAALKLTGALPSGPGRLSECLDPAQQNPHTVPTRENPAH